MISYLSVRNFKLADFVEIEFEPGFTVLTGETGAGKSLIVDALGLLLGNRAKSDTIASGADRAEFQAAIEVPDGHQAHDWLKQRDLDADGDCILRRILSKRTSSRAFINGNPVSVQELKDLGGILVDIHGQHEHQHLLSREQQRIMLDAFAGAVEDVAQLSEIFSAMRDIEGRLERLKNRSAADRDRAQLLGFQIKELEALNLDPERDATIQSDYNRIAHAQELMQGASGLLDLLLESDGQSISEQLGRASHTLKGLLLHDTHLKSIAEGLETLTIEVSELANDVRLRLPDYEYDPEELDRLQKRLDILHHTSKKYSVDIIELPHLLEQLRAELKNIAGDDDTIALLEQEHRQISEHFGREAAALRKKRAKAAKLLSTEVGQQLADLGMPAAKFAVQLIPLDTPRPSGTETIEFLIATNPGQDPGALSRVASGGELSRTALAINMVLNQGNTALTQIYDEVDAGIGGRVAEMVGQKLRAVAQARQVLCVTHLPQVASQGQFHKRVRKSGKNTAAIEIESLEEIARTEEIARMLGGIEITDRTLEHAGEMLTRAHQ